MEVWRLLVVGLVLLLLPVIIFLPVQTHVTVEQRSWQLAMQVQVTIAGLIRLQRGVDISDKIAMAMEHMLKRWRATGEPVKIPLQKTIRRFPKQRVSAAVRGPIRYFRRRLRVRTLDIHLEIGGYDAMQSAMLAGAAWSIVGAVLGVASRLVTLDPATPRVEIVPIFGGPACRMEVNCILRYRLGNAIVVGVWLLSRMLMDREIRAWMRDSWRRKGVEGSGRASDSGPDEDGHGEP